jgi:hypothetical protein
MTADGPVWVRRGCAGSVRRLSGLPRLPTFLPCCRESPVRARNGSDTRACISLSFAEHAARRHAIAVH